MGYWFGWFHWEWFRNPFSNSFDIFFENSFGTFLVNACNIFFSSATPSEYSFGNYFPNFLKIPSVTPPEFYLIPSVNRLGCVNSLGSFFGNSFVKWLGQFVLKFLHNLFGSSVDNLFRFFTATSFKIPWQFYKQLQRTAERSFGKFLKQVFNFFFRQFFWEFFRHFLKFGNYFCNFFSNFRNRPFLLYFQCKLLQQVRLEIYGIPNGLRIFPKISVSNLQRNCRRNLQKMCWRNYERNSEKNCLRNFLKKWLKEFPEELPNEIWRKLKKNYRRISRRGMLMEFFKFPEKGIPTSVQ